MAPSVETSSVFRILIVGGGIAGLASVSYKSILLHIYKAESKGNRSARTKKINTGTRAVKSQQRNWSGHFFTTQCFTVSH
jgi:succinate dehydrogenase/fumarate reductase flavoprotein subunit